MKKRGKRAAAWILSVGMLITGLPTQGLTVQGAEERAQQVFIDTPQELLEFARTVNEGDSFRGREAVLAKDLNMEGMEMEAIGTAEVPFRGTFEGQGCEISNLSIEGGDNQGLFGVVQGGTVQNVNLTQAQITGGRNTGGIVGSSSGTIKNCTFEGNVQGAESVGGIVGVQTGGSITRCSSQVEVSGTGNDAGGVLGKGNGGRTQLCSSEGSVSGGTGTCGGVAGYLNGTSVSNCYSKADVSTTGANIGGIIGGIDGNSPARFCYATGSITNSGTGNEGGAVGWNRAGAVSDCYYNSDNYSGAAIGSNESGGTAYGKSAEELMLEETYEGFDFASVWTFAEGVNEGYPVFLPEKPADERVEADYQWLTFDQIKGQNVSEQEITENLDLPVQGLNGSKIYWSSSNPDVLLNSGVLASGLNQQAEVTLTAYITAEGEERQKQFTVTVLPTDKEDRPLHILQIGDSNTEFARITQSMNQILKDEYGMYGDGFLTLCKDYINIAPEHFSIEYGGQWYQYDLVYGAGELAGAQDTPFGLYAQSRQAGDTITVQFAGSAVDIYYLSWAGAGTFRVTIDGVDYGEVVQTSDEFVTKKAVYEGLSYGLHTMVIENVSGVINFYGADYRVDQAESRKNISTWGKAGIQAKQYAVDLNETVFKTALTQLDPDVVVILLGTNDNGWAACPADTLEGYLDTIIKRVKEALPQTEIWVLSTFETVNSKEILHSYWDSAFPNAAKKNDVHYWSMGEWFGPYTTKQMADGWHSNLESSQKIAEKLYEVILGGEDVVGRNAVSLQQPEGITAASNTAFEDLELPERVQVQLDDLQQSKVWTDVTWSQKGYQESSGTYKLTGELVLPETERIYNPQGLKAEIQVTLEDDYQEDQKLRMHYDFENVDNGNIPDLTGTYTGKLAGNARIGEAMTGNGAVLPGDSGSYIEIPKEALEDCDAMTLSMWIKLDQISDWTTLFSIGSETDNYVVVAAAGSPQGVPCGVTAAIMADGGSEYRIKAPADQKVPVGQWVQVAYTQAYGKAKLYLNGALVAQEDDMPVSFQDVIRAGGTQIRLGAANAWPDPAMKGTVEEVKIYGQALTQEEIQETIRQKEDEVQAGETPVATKIEAETAQLSGLAKTVARPDASGGYKVGTIDNADSLVTFTLEAPEDGTYRIELATDSGNDQPNGSHQYYVNGQKDQAKIVHYEPKGWDVWTRYPIEVELKKGTNTFTVTHSGLENSFSELDYIVFYRSYPQVEGLALDGEPLEGFDAETRTYEVQVEDLENLPEVDAILSEGTKEDYDVTVTGGETTTVTIANKEDKSFQITYRVRFYDENAFASSIVNFGADPFVTYQDGYYYYVRVHKDKEIYVSRAKELNRIAQTEPVKVYEPTGTEPNQEMWAPEIHFLNGKWYIYYTAGAGSAHRMYVLESKTEDALGAYEFKGEMSPTTNRWAIDQTVLELDGELYAIWSGWEGTENVSQRIYIARMSDPMTITGERVELSRPEYNWELDGNPTINEGPQIAVSPEGVVNIIYSASGSWTDNYCLGRLTLRGEDPMDADSWEKGEESIFHKNGNTTYSTGHASFVKSPDGTEDYMVFHATRGAGQGWNGRGVRTQQFTWNEDGTPNFGEALDYDAKVNMPSGTEIAERTRYEAEDAELLGGAAKAETYNSSSDQKVTGMNNAGDGIRFQIEAETDGIYKLYVGAATSEEGAGFDVQANEGRTQTKRVVNFNASAAEGLCPDNWMGYEVEVELKKGENQVAIRKNPAMAMPDLDYVDVELVELAETDKTDLQTLYDLNKSRLEENYTPESWAPFKEAFDRAKAVLEDAKASQEEVDAAAKALSDAAGALTPAEGSPTEEDLKEALEAAEAAKKEAEEAARLAEEAKQKAEELKKEAEVAEEAAEEAWEKAQEMAGASEEAKKEAIAQAEKATKLAEEARKKADEALEAAEAAERARDLALAAAESYQKEAEAIKARLEQTKEEIAKAAEEARKAKEEAERLKKEAEESARLAEETLKKLQEREAAAREEAAKKNRTYAIGKLKYKVTDTSAKTVSVVGAKKKTYKTLTIPATVKIEGETYKVTAIEKNAFKANKKLKQVTIGKNVTSIGKNAFRQAASLKQITVKSKSIKTVGKSAFKGIQKKAVIQVPSGRAKAYRKLIQKSGVAKTIKVK